jgi:hypothetical protein
VAEGAGSEDQTMSEDLETRLGRGLEEVQALGSVAEEAFFERLRAELVEPVLELPDLVTVALYRFLCRHERADDACHLAAARTLMQVGELETAAMITSAVLEAEPRSVAARSLWRDLQARVKAASATAPRRARARTRA